MKPTLRIELVEAIQLALVPRRSQLSRIPEALFHVDSPDLGWNAAGLIAKTWVPPRKLFWMDQREFWLTTLRRPEFSNIHGAVGLIMDDVMGEIACDQPLAAKAEKIAGDPSVSSLLKALLFSKDACPVEVGNLLGMEPDVVRAFGDLFFDVEDRANDQLFRQTVLAWGKRSETACLFPPSKEVKLRFHLISVACHGTMQDVMDQFILSQGGGTEMKYAASIRKECFASALSETLSGCRETSLPARTGFALAAKGTTSGAEAQTGTLYDPFLEDMYAQSHAYNELFRAKQREAAAKAEQASDNESE